jgi:catechol 2,3-dioxygenase-like lactoylglutathione lyase family enzyme
MISKALDVGLVAYDYEAMLAFYQHGLGLPLIDTVELPGGLMSRFQAGAGVIKINQQPGAKSDPAPGDLSRSRGMKLLTLLVPDLQATSRNLQVAGFPALTIQDYNGRSLAFTVDPNNSMIELLAEESSGPEPVLRAVGLTVGDMDASHTFFTQVLGFAEGTVEPIPSLNTDKVEFKAGATTLKLWEISELQPHTGPIHDYAGIRYLTVRVDDMDEILSRARSAGYNVPLAPMQFAPGLHIAMIEDPDGNWFEITAAQSANAS